MELFDAEPTSRGQEAIARNPANKWLDEAEIRRLEAHDVRAVSVSMGVILGLANLVSDDVYLRNNALGLGSFSVTAVAMRPTWRTDCEQHATERVACT